VGYRRSGRAVPAPTHIEPHVERVTLHPSYLAAARRIVVVATGAAKADALGRAWTPADRRARDAGSGGRSAGGHLVRRRGGGGPHPALSRGPVTGPFPDAPSRVVAGAGGVPIAVFSVGSGPPLVLVHGTTADHTAWRTVAPSWLRTTRSTRSTGADAAASGDGPRPRPQGYALDLEYADVAAVVDALAAETAIAVDVVGHSYGGRCGLGARGADASLRRLCATRGAGAARASGSSATSWSPSWSAASRLGIRMR
jgi:hypothetical protein